MSERCRLGLKLCAEAILYLHNDSQARYARKCGTWPVGVNETAPGLLLTAPVVIVLLLCRDWHWLHRYIQLHLGMCRTVSSIRPALPPLSIPRPRGRPRGCC